MAGRLLTDAVNIEAILGHARVRTRSRDVARWHIACYRASR
jgi:hypothetical protein